MKTRTKIAILIECAIDCLIFIGLSTLMFYLGLTEEKLSFIYGGWFLMGVAAFSAIFGYRWKLATQKLFEEMQKNLTPEEEKTLEMKIIEISKLMKDYGFEMTDMDSDNGMVQFYKSLPEVKHWYVQFEILVDEIFHAVIDPTDYERSELVNYCSSYGWDLKTTPSQLIAEAIFETDMFEFQSDLTYSSGYWKELFKP